MKKNFILAIAVLTLSATTHADNFICEKRTVNNATHNLLIEITRDGKCQDQTVFTNIELPANRMLVVYNPCDSSWFASVQLEQDLHCIVNYGKLERW
jgi:hypothetical protein